MAALHTSAVVGADPPARWALFLHGILGSGSNWRTFARRFVDAHPGYGALLVDLRLHGGSLEVAGPHTIQAAAQDLVELAATLSVPVEAIVGHSFGGKVALAYVDRCHGALDRAFILDSTPGTRIDQRGSESTVRVLALLGSIGPTPTRKAFVEQVVAAGQSLGLAQWLAMNLEQRGDAFVVKLDLQAVGELLEDYFRRDLWELLERPPGRVHFDMVLGGQSSVFDAADRQRLTRAAQAHPARVRVHTLPTAGHWLHVDDPQGLTALLTAPWD